MGTCHLCRRYIAAADMAEHLRVIHPVLGGVQQWPDAPRPPRRCIHCPEAELEHELPPKRRLCSRIHGPDGTRCGCPGFEPEVADG